MSQETIKKEVQLFSRDVEGLVQRKLGALDASRDLLRDEALTELETQLQCSEEELRQSAEHLERQREKLEKALNSSARKRSSNSEFERELRKELEISSRKLELTIPQDQSDFLAALFWMSQHGDNEEALDLIQTVKANPPHYSQDIGQLLNRAEEEISGRLPTKLMD
jgi:hypothetical protein